MSRQDCDFRATVRYRCESQAQTRVKFSFSNYGAFGISWTRDVYASPGQFNPDGWTFNSFFGEQYGNRSKYEWKNELPDMSNGKEIEMIYDGQEKRLTIKSGGKVDVQRNNEWPEDP